MEPTMTYEQMCADYANGLLLQLAELWYCKMTEAVTPELEEPEETGVDDDE